MGRFSNFSPLSQLKNSSNFDFETLFILGVYKTITTELEWLRDPLEFVYEGVAHATSISIDLSFIPSKK